MENPFVSVIMPTFHRGEILCSTVGQLLNQKYDNYELIVVDQLPNHDPDTYSSIAQLRNNYSNFLYFSCDFSGLPLARNFGLKIAKGEIILFVDDDITTDENWILSHVKNYEDIQIGGVVGRIHERKPDLAGDRFGKLFGKVGEITFWGRPIRNFDSGKRRFVKSVGGGNMSFRKKVISVVGDFDTRFRGNAQFEETDFSYRVRKAGYKIIYDPLASLIHLSYPSGGCRNRSQIEWYADYLHNKALFFRKNMPISSHIPFFIIHFLIAFREGLIKGKSFKTFQYLVIEMIRGYRLGAHI